MFFLSALAFALTQSPPPDTGTSLKLDAPRVGRLLAPASADAPSQVAEYQYVSADERTVAIELRSCEFDARYRVIRDGGAGALIDRGGIETDAWSRVQLRAGERVAIEVSASDRRAGDFVLRVSGETVRPLARPEALRDAIARWGDAAASASAAGNGERAFACSMRRARLLLRLGEATQARAAVEAAAAAATSGLPRERAVEAQTFLAELDLLDAQLDAATERLERLKGETSEPASRRARSWVLDALGRAYVQRNRMDLAVACHQEELELARAMNARDQECRALKLLAMARSRADQVADAEDLFRETLALAALSEDPDLQAESELAYGWHLSECGLPRDALQHYERALELEPYPLLRVDVLGSMGNALRELLRPVDARRRYAESMSLAGEVGAMPYAGKYLLSFGNLETALGDIDVAVQLLEAARDLSGGKSRELDRAEILLSLAYARQVRGNEGDFESAASEASEALEIGEAFGDLRIEVGATVLLSNGFDPDAPAPGPLRARMERLNTKAAGSADLDTIAKACAMLAWDDFKLRRYDTAIAGGNHAYECFADLSEDRQCLAGLDTVARAALRTGDAEALAHAVDRAEWILDRADLRDLDAFAIARLCADFAFEDLSHDLLALRLRQPAVDGAASARWRESGFETAAAWKARSLVDSLVRRKLGGPATETDAVRTARATFVRARERIETLARLRVSGPALDAALREVSESRRKLEDLERRNLAALGVANPTRLARSGTVSAVRAALPDERSALIEYVAGTEELYAHVLTRKGLEFVTLGARKEIEERARCFVSVLATDRLPQGAPADAATGPKGLDRLARSLYASLLVKPLAVLDPSVKRLILVPTVELADVPFEALIDPASPSPVHETRFGDLAFLIKEYCVVSAPSSAALVELASQKRPKLDSTMLVLADPAYRESSAPKLAGSPARGPGSDSAYPELDLDLPRLENTRREAAQVAGLLVSLEKEPRDEDAASILAVQNGAKDHFQSRSGFEMFLGREATAACFRDHAGRFSILHIAAHGFRTTSAYADPIIALSPTSGDNGALTCGQILQLDLHADLVVLAACDTARGRGFDGEGVRSIARAFLHSGASTVIASLWEAPDLQAGDLMTRFYGKLFRQRLASADGQRLAPADALREVKLELIAGQASRGAGPDARLGMVRFAGSDDPYYWAAFVVLGAPK